MVIDDDEWRERRPWTRSVSVCARVKSRVVRTHTNRDMHTLLLCTYPAITGQENGVALDVPVDDSLRVQVGQSPQHRQTHGGNLLLVHPEDTHTKQCIHVTQNQRLYFTY